MFDIFLHVPITPLFHTLPTALLRNFAPKQQGRSNGIRGQRPQLAQSQAARTRPTSHRTGVGGKIKDRNNNAPTAIIGRMFDRFLLLGHKCSKQWCT